MRLRELQPGEPITTISKFEQGVVQTQAPNGEHFVTLLYFVEGSLLGPVGFVLDPDEADEFADAVKAQAREVRRLRGG